MQTRTALDKFCGLALVLLFGLAPTPGTAQGLLPPPPPNYTPTPYPPPRDPITQLPPPTELNAAPLGQDGSKKAEENVPIYPFADRAHDFKQTGFQGEKEQEFALPAELPGPSELFRRRLSEAQWKEQQRQEAKRYNLTKNIIFPDNPPLTLAKFKARDWQPSGTFVTPGYVLHDRLPFEQPNFERYGWELGVLGPPVQLGTYFFDLAMLPYREFSRPLDQIDGSAGKYLPGDNVPLMLYPESFSLTGLAGWAGSYAAGPFVFK